MNFIPANSTNFDPKQLVIFGSLVSLVESMRWLDTERIQWMVLSWCARHGLFHTFSLRQLKSNSGTATSCWRVLFRHWLQQIRTQHIELFPSGKCTTFCDFVVKEAKLCFSTSWAAMDSRLTRCRLTGTTATNWILTLELVLPLQCRETIYLLDYQTINVTILCSWIIFFQISWTSWEVFSLHSYTRPIRTLHLTEESVSFTFDKALDKGRVVWRCDKIERTWTGHQIRLRWKRLATKTKKISISTPPRISLIQIHARGHIDGMDECKARGVNRKKCVCHKWDHLVRVSRSKTTFKESNHRSLPMVPIVRSMACVMQDRGVEGTTPMDVAATPIVTSWYTLYIMNSSAVDCKYLSVFPNSCLSECELVRMVQIVVWARRTGSSYV